jgi:hypothetical protein
MQNLNPYQLIQPQSKDKEDADLAIDIEVTQPHRVPMLAYQMCALPPPPSIPPSVHVTWM